MSLFANMSRISMRALGRDIAVAGVAGAGADLICQRLERHVDATRETEDGFNIRRNLAFAAFGGLYIGGVCGRLYTIYPRVATWMFGAGKVTPRLEGAVSTCMDNFLHVPLMYIPSFYMAVAGLRGEGTDAGFETLQQNWSETVVTCWAFWLPAQYVIFSKVPAAYRVRAVASMDFAWNIVLSYIAHKKPVASLASVPDAFASEVLALAQAIPECVAVA